MGAGGRGRGYSDIFSYTQALATFCGVEILNFSIFGGLQKKDYFLGMMKL